MAIPHTASHWAERQLQRAFVGLTFTCTFCRVTKAVGPPFNLIHFACGVCGKVSHPFVKRGEQILDLRYLRELLISCYHTFNTARGVLIQASRRHQRGRPWDAQILRAVIIPHAMDAFAHHRRLHISVAFILAGAVVPFVHLFQHRYQLLTRNDRLRAWIKDGQFSLSAFDPRHLLAPEFIIRAEPDPDIFWADLEPTEDSGTVVHRIDQRSHSLDGMGEPASSWNIAIDRSCTLPTPAPAVSMVDGEFSTRVASRACEALSQGPTLTCARREVVFCRSELSDSALGPRGLFDAQGFPEPRWTDHQYRRILDCHEIRTLEVEPLQILESCDHRTGIVYHTCIRVSSLANLTSVRWRVFCWGPSDAGIRDDQGELDRTERELCDAEIAERKPSLMRILGGLMGLVLASPAILWIVMTGAVAPLYVFLCGVSFLSALFMAGLAAHRNANSLPREVLRGQKWQDRMAEAAIEASWRQLDRSALRGITGVYGPASIQHDWLVDEVDFTLHAHNEILLDAIIDEAESMGIDMKEFKDHVFELNNFGVIASQINGPVAAGANSRASSAPKSHRGTYAKSKRP